MSLIAGGMCLLDWGGFSPVVVLLVCNGCLYGGWEGGSHEAHCMDHVMLGTFGGHLDAGGAIFVLELVNGLSLRSSSDIFNKHT